MVMVIIKEEIVHVANSSFFFFVYLFNFPLKNVFEAYNCINVTWSLKSLGGL